ncbi:MAG: hypothetical protein HUU34_11425 [Saprospiraceae bacterium]|nr:hypothetical protein [Saprospiraceae bacterium]
MKKRFNSQVFFTFALVHLGCLNLKAQSLASVQQLNRYYTTEINSSYNKSLLVSNKKNRKIENKRSTLFPKQSSYDSQKGGKSEIDFVGDGNIQKSFAEGGGFSANTGLGVVFYREWADDKSDGIDQDAIPEESILMNIPDDMSLIDDTLSNLPSSNTIPPNLPSGNNKNKKNKMGKNPFQDIEFSLKINVASTADTIFGKIDNATLSNRRDFGTYLLIPVNSKQAASVDFFGYFAHRRGWTRLINGVNVNFTASNSIWKTDTTTSFLAGVMLKAGVFYDFVPDQIRKEKKYGSYSC